MTKCRKSDTYFRTDQFCRRNHDKLEVRRKLRQETIDLTRGNPEQQVVLVFECDMQAYPDFAAGSMTALSRAALSTLPEEEHAATLKSRFSVTGSEIEYQDMIDGDHSDFGEAYGAYRR